MSNRRPLPTISLALLAACAEAPGPDPAGPGPGDSAEPVDPEPGQLLEGGVVACADPSARAVTPLYLPTEAGDFGNVQPLGTLDRPSGWGASVADFDGDGVFDLLLPQYGSPQLFRGNGRGRFDLVSGAFPEAPDASTYGSSAADFDGDADLDVYFTAMGPDALWLNDGGGHFVDHSAAAGLVDEPFDSVHAAWADYDGDGDLDLAVANYWTEELHPNAEEKGWVGDPNVVWENREGVLVDRSDTLAWRNASLGFTYAAGWWDVDGDLRPELHVINDKGDEGFANALARWDGASFVDIGTRSGLDVSIQGMGLGAADLNGDGVPDFLVSDWGELLLLVSDGVGGWYDAAFARGLDLPLDDERVIGWGAELEDLDNDGDADALVTFGNDDLFRTTRNEDGVESTLRQPDGVWLQGEDGHFALATDTWQLGDPGVGRGFVLADLDDNGWLDIVKRDLLGYASVRMQRCGAEGWLRVALQGPAPNIRGIGARVEVEAGDRRWVRWIHAGSTNIASSGPPEAHVGLGAFDTIDTLRVTWPDGGVQVFHDVTTRQRLTVVRE